MKPAQLKPKTLLSVINQKKAMDSRKAKTPIRTDENKIPDTVITPGTPTSHYMSKIRSSRKDNVTPLGISGKANRRRVNPSTPTRTTPSKPQQTPTRSERTVLFEFEHDLLITPGNNENTGLSIYHTSSIQVEPTPTKPPQNSGSFNRSRSACSITRTSKRDRAKLRRSLSESKLPCDNCDYSFESEDKELSRISVGVRVRPLQAREHGSTLVVDGNEVKVASELGSVLSFPLDHVFGQTTSQEDVYNAMVKPLLDSAFQGYNACLLAYGQTGSGKTYSMMGKDTLVEGICESTGIIPRFCQELIERTAKVSDEPGGDNVHMSTSVEVSYLEVYNEKIRDLLIPPPSQPLKVREHPVLGPYVADLSKHSVNTFNDIQHWISEGNKQRAIAATEMNEKSSRSHSLFMVILTQSIIQNDNSQDGWAHENTRRSQINLVDLAGSERIAHSSVTSDRLREGVSINLSLMTLGKVISALVDKRSFVPYRESVLTWLLKESLGGNSRTSMLATVSPSSSHRDETMATLRYATQARSILNTARVNESPQNKMIRELRAEIERLKVCVENESGPSSRIVSPADVRRGETVELLSELAASRELVEDLKSKLAESERALLNLEKEGIEKADFASNERDIELKKYKNDYENLKKRFEELVLEHGTSLELCSEKERAAESFKRRAQTAQNEIIELQSQVESSRQEKKRLTETIDELMGQKTEWTHKLEAMERSVQEWKSDRKKNEEELKLKAEIAEKEIEMWRDRVEAYNNRSKEQLSRTVSMENSLEKWKNKIRTVEQECEKLAASLQDETNQKHHWKQEFERSNDLLKLTETKVNDLQQKLNDCKTMLDIKQKEMDNWSNIKQEMETQLTETCSELHATKDNVKTISVQVDSSSFPQITQLNVSIQTCDDLQRKSSSVICAEVAEQVVQCDMKGSQSDDTLKIERLEKALKTQSLEMAEMANELELLRELELKYKAKLDESLPDKQTIQEVESRLRTTLEKLHGAEKNIAEQDKRFKNLKCRYDKLKAESEHETVHLNRLLNLAEGREEELRYDLSYLQDSGGESLHIANIKIAELELKLDQKNKLIVELEKIANKAKETTESVQQSSAKRKKSALANLDEAKKKCDQYCQTILELEDQLKTISEKLNMCEKENSDQSPRFQELQCQLKESTEERDSLHLNVQDLNLRLADTLSKLDASVKERCDLNTRVQDLESRLRISKDSSDESERKVTQYGQAIMELESRLRTVQEKCSDFEETSSQCKIRIQDLTAELEIAHEALATAGKECTEHILRIEDLESRLRVAQDDSRCITQEKTGLESRVQELESRLNTTRIDLEEVDREKILLTTKLCESNEKSSDLEKNLKVKDQQLVLLHEQLVSVEKMLQQQMSNKFEELNSLRRQDTYKEDEISQRDAVAVENIRYKTELELTKEQLKRKKDRLEKMKSTIDKLEDLLMSTMRQAVERKSYVMIKSEHAKVFDCMMETSYLFHWEYVLRKARAYAHKYHIPYEFEKFDGATAVVKHLLYNAKSYWFRIDFKIWFENIEKNDKWCRKLDEDLAWEVDFGNYYNIPSEKPGALCPIDESACEDIQYCCKPGVICPGVWKKTIVHRHLSGLEDDAKCLLIYFKSSKKQEVIELLQVITNLAEQLRDLLSVKT